MAGEAQSQAFLLASATVMVGPLANLMDLTPAANSLGLVKNFSISTTPGYVDLTQGVKSAVVFSTMTKNDVKGSCEVFEYTSKNLTYGLGLDGSTVVAQALSYPLNATLTGNTGSPVITATFSAATDVTAAFPIGTWIMIQENLGDQVHYAKLSATTTKTGAGPFIHTVTFAAQGLKTGNNFSLAARIGQVNVILIGSKADQPFLAMKVVGTLPDESDPIAFYIPKVRITKGFTVSFTDANYGNMPFEFSPYVQTPGDPFYGVIAVDAYGQLMSRN